MRANHLSHPTIGKVSLATLLITVCCLSTSAPAAERTMRVAGNHAYLRDESGEIVRTLSRLTNISVLDNRGDKYLVRYRKASGWVHKGQLVADPTYSLDGIAPELHDQVRTALLLHQEALVFIEMEQDVKRATQRLTRALEIVQQVYGSGATQASILKELAYFHASEGDFEDANLRLQQATQMLAASDLANDPLLLAELENAKGHVATGEEVDLQAAVLHYERALEIAQSAFGEVTAMTAALSGNLGRAYGYTGNLQKCKELAEQQLAITRKVFGDDTNELSYAYILYAETLGALGKHDTACKFAARALKIRLELFGPDSLFAAQAHSNLAFQLWGNGQLSESEAQHERVLEICRTIDDPKSENIETNTRELLIDMLQQANRPVQALAHVGPLIERLQQSKRDHSQRIAQLQQLTNTLTAQANRPQAGPGQMLIVLGDGRIQGGTTVLANVAPGTRLWSLNIQDGWHNVLLPWSTTDTGWIRASSVTSVEARLYMAMQREIDFGEKQQFAANMAMMFAEKGELFAKTDPTREDLAEAMQIVDQVAEQVERAAGNNFMLATIRQTLATMYGQFGESGKARKHLEGAVAIHRQHLGNDHPQTAATRLTLGQLLASVGDVVGAERAFREALRVFELTVGENNEATSSARGALGVHLVNAGLVREGQEILEQVVASEEQAGRTNGVALLIPHQSLGGIAFKDNRPLDGLDHLAKARNVLEAHPELGNVTSAILLTMQQGIFQLRAGQPANALDNLSRAHANSTTDLGPNHTITATAASFLGYANALYDRDLDLALRLAKTGLRGIERATSPDHIDTAEPLFTLAAITYHRGELDQTLDFLERARVVTNRYAREVLVELPAQAQVQFLEQNHRRKRDAALSLALNHSDNQDVIDRTARWMLNSKSLAIETAAARESLQSFLKTEYSHNQFALWQDLRRRISTFPLEGANDRVRDARKSELYQLKVRERRLAQTVAPGFAEQVVRQQRGMVSLRSVRDAIADDAVLIEFLRLKPIAIDRVISPDTPKPARYVAWIIRPSGPEHVEFVDLGTADKIDTLVADAQQAILDAPRVLNDAGEIEATKVLRAVMQPLHDQLWLPLRKRLGDTKKVILSPDASLWLVAWAALPIDDQKYLVEDYEVRLVNTGRDLVSPAATVGKVNGPVVIADPAFDSEAQVIEDTLRNLDLDIPRTRAVAFNGRFGRVRRLPGTRIEAETIEPSLEASHDVAPDVFMGDEAAEGVFKSLASPKTLMIGTHGFVLSEDQTTDTNPLVRCGLLLAGCNARPENLAATGEDGVLTGAEIVGTDLRGTELVVLSACQTGLGQIQDGEGVAGLRQAFQLAGAHSVVATLWEIPDAATARLMVALFDELAQRKSKPSALRAAQMTRIDALRKRNGAAHPFLWAAFTLTGRQ